MIDRSKTVASIELRSLCGDDQLWQSRGLQLIDWFKNSPLIHKLLVVGMAVVCATIMIPTDGCFYPARGVEHRVAMAFASFQMWVAGQLQEPGNEDKCAEDLIFDQAFCDLDATFADVEYVWVDFTRLRPDSPATDDAPIFIATIDKGWWGRKAVVLTRGDGKIVDQLPDVYGDELARMTTLVSEGKVNRPVDGKTLLEPRAAMRLDELLAGEAAIDPDDLVTARMTINSNQPVASRNGVYEFEYQVVFENLSAEAIELRLEAGHEIGYLFKDGRVVWWSEPSMLPAVTHQNVSAGATFTFSNADRVRFIQPGEYEYVVIYPAKKYLIVARSTITLTE